jgi:hypothetical protein
MSLASTQGFEGEELTRYVYARRHLVKDTARKALGTITHVKTHRELKARLWLVIDNATA